MAAGSETLQSTGGLPAVMGTRGVVASASPLASTAGLKVLMDGGNAVDAAVTVASILSVDEPYYSGIGGHGIAMLYVAGTGEVKCLDFGGFAPRAFTVDQWGSPPRYRYWDVRSSVFPGSLAGWTELLERHGTRSLAQALEPAIGHARRGVPARPVVVDFIARLKHEMARFPELAGTYLPGGRVPRAGQVIANRGLADTYEEIAGRGVSHFYEGPLRDRIVEYYNQCGSRFTEREFSAYRPRWRDTLESTYRDDYRVVVPKCQTCSPNILTQLNVWEHFDLAELDDQGFERIHLGIETAKIAFSDRRIHCGDPDFSAVPYQRLASKDYAADLAPGIDPNQARSERFPGDRADNVSRGGTTHLTVVDRDRNAVAMTCTLGPSFGCMHTVPGTGIILNNEGVFFDLHPPDGPNYPAAGKRVQHDMSPTLVFRGDRLFLALGTPGALGITQTIPQVISKVVDHRLPLQSAIESDRYRYFGEGRVRVGDNIPAAIRDRLRDAGHEVLPSGAPPIWAGGFHAVAIDPDSGTLIGGADPRRGGLAVAY